MEGTKLFQRCGWPRARKGIEWKKNITEVLLYSRIKARGWSLEGGGMEERLLAEGGETRS